MVLAKLNKNTRNETNINNAAAVLPYLSIPPSAPLEIPIAQLGSNDNKSAISKTKRNEMK